jgi:hypothetical protein
MAAEHDLKIKALTTATAGPPSYILERKDLPQYLNKIEKLVTNTIAASKHIPK